jgi:hypothetical protein
MAETGLSYEGDIAPLKQQYFQQVFADPRLKTTLLSLHP